MFGDLEMGNISPGRMITLSGVNVLATTIKSGEYFCSNCSNTPTGADGYLSVRRINTNYAELSFRNYSGTMYKAIQNNGSWTNWKINDLAPINQVKNGTISRDTAHTSSITAIIRYYSAGETSLAYGTVTLSTAYTAKTKMQLFQIDPAPLYITPIQLYNSNNNVCLDGYIDTAGKCYITNYYEQAAPVTLHFYVVYYYAIRF